MKLYQIKARLQQNINKIIKIQTNKQKKKKKKLMKTDKPKKTTKQQRKD